MDFYDDDEREEQEAWNGAYPHMMPYPMQYPPMMPYPGRSAPSKRKNGKSDKERAEEKAKKQAEFARQKRNKTIDRFFWSFWLVMALLLLFKTNFGG